MLYRKDQGRTVHMARSLMSGLWRHARQALAMAIMAVMVSSSLLVKVQAAAGSLDTTFSGDGKQTTVFNGLEVAHAIALQSNGKIVVAGYTRSVSVNNDFALARYNTNGTLDTTFSSDGKLTTDFSGGRDDGAYAVAIQSDGKIVVAGYTEISFDDTDFALARYNTNGTLDTTFSTDGKQNTDLGDGSEEIATAIAIQPNGKIVVGGATELPNVNDAFALARYNTNGTLDTTFSSDGKLTTNFSAGDDRLGDLALQSNGKIVAVGAASSEPPNGSHDFALARYNGSGTLDTTFSGDGKLTTDFFGNTDGASAVVIQADGKIIAAGLARLTQEMTSGNFALARYNGNGSLDDGSANDSTPNDSFGTNGRVTTNFFGSNDHATALAIQSDGKIVAAGRASHADSTGYNFALARYNPDGTRDTTFGLQGRKATDFFGNSDDQANGMVMQADGKIVLAGFARRSVDTANYNFALARYHDE